MIPSVTPRDKSSSPMCFDNTVTTLPHRSFHTFDPFEDPTRVTFGTLSRTSQLVSSYSIRVSTLYPSDDPLQNRLERSYSNMPKSLLRSFTKVVMPANSKCDSVFGILPWTFHVLEVRALLTTTIWRITTVLL